MIPFPVAVALWSMEEVGALPSKMMLSILMMLVCFLAHIDYTVSANPRRPREKVRPRLPAFPCAAPGGKKSPTKETFIADTLQKRVIARFPYLVAPMTAGMSFAGGSTARGMDQFMENGGYLGIFVDESCNFFSRRYPTTGESSQSENFHPPLLLSFRTGAPPERALMKDKNKVAPDHSQVGMMFLSQFPAARNFIVKIIANCSNGWAQGFLFTFSIGLNIIC